MKKNYWCVYLFEEIEHKNIFKIMKFDTIKEVSFVLNIPPQTISNYFHGLIKPRGILNYCVLYQSIPL
jgi:hypothetical protein